MKSIVVKRLLVLTTCLALIVSVVGASVSAQGIDCIPRGVVNTDGAIQFKGLNQLCAGQILTVETTDRDGNPATMSIRLPENNEYDGPIGGGGSTSKTWEVSFYGAVINARFYITVTDNVVTDVYDEWVLIVGGTHSDLELEKTNTYGKLSFNLQVYGGVMGSHCWLKATVTGSGNEVTITKMM